MAEKRLSIRMLGKLSVSCEDVTIAASDSRSKAWLMLAYLICNRNRPVSSEELSNILSDGADSGDPIRMLRNARWNIRRALAPISSALDCELIVNLDGTFGWNPNVSVTLDAEEMETLCAAAENAESDEERKRLLSAAAALYCGSFLGLFGNFFWVSRLAVYYQNLYLNAVNQLLSLLGRDEAAEAVELCRAALRISPYDEELSRRLMRALTDLGDCEGADAVYQQLRARLSEDLGVLPEQQTFAAHQQIANRVGSRLLAPDTIRDQLREENAAGGAMICDYTSFRLLYRAEARSAGRRGDAIHIALISLTGKGGKKLSPRSMKWAMNRLGAEIAKTLRTGDIAANCSASQYLIMLLQANEENAKMVCERLTRTFEREHPDAAATIGAVVFPLEPLQAMAKDTARESWQYFTK